MDVEYIYDTINNKHSIEIPAEHGVIARFLANEIEVSRREPAAIESLINALCCEGEHELRFKEWTLEFDREEVKIIHNSLFQEVEGHAEFDFGNTDWQLSCHCGKQDLIEMLANWVEFVANE